jgi:hypothetical protein
VRAVCDRLLNTVEASLPTVILGARDSAGNDLVAVRVRVDGGIVAEAMDGKAVPIDPGPHTLRFEREGGEAIEQTLVVREAEKNRSVVVTFGLTKSRPAVPRAAEDPLGPRPIPVLVYVLGGVSVAALGAFVGLDVAGQSRYESCLSQPCPQSTVSSLEVERGLAYGSLGLGVLSLGVATWLFLARPHEPRTAPLRLDVEGRRGGGVLCAVGTF